MAYLEPKVEFWKGAVGKAWGTSVANLPALQGATYDDARISYGDGSAGGYPGQSGNWLNKIATGNPDSVEGETDLWADPLPAALQSAGIDSGAGFVNEATSERDILQGNLSCTLNVIVFNNRELQQGGIDGVSYTTAENCKLRMFDEPFSDLQTADPISTVAGGEHRFWPIVRQLSYWTYSFAGTAWTQQAAKTYPGPYGLGQGSTFAGGAGANAPLLAPSSPSDWDAVPTGAPEGVGQFYIGSETKSYIGCLDTSLDPPAENDGAAAEIQMLLVVPSTAVAKLHWWAMAVEYTFVVE